MGIKKILTVKGMFALTFFIFMVSCSSTTCINQIAKAPSWIKQSCFISETKMFGVGFSPLFQDSAISEKIAIMDAYRTIQEYNKLELESVQLAGSEIHSASSFLDISMQYYNFTSQSSNIYSHLAIEDFYVNDEYFWILVSVDLDDISSL